VPPRNSLGDWLGYAESRFRKARLHFGHGTHNAREEAAWLLSHVTATVHDDLRASLARPLSATQARAAQRLIERRVRTRAPLAYLLKEAWLGEHRFYVDERVIVPRSYIAELLRERLQPWVANPSGVTGALDMCTGSGCLAVLLAFAFPLAAVDAADISAPALAVAGRNVGMHRLRSRVRLIRSDLFDRIGPGLYDVIVANPPYVDARAMKALPAEYRKEPRPALAGGSDGLDFARRILDAAPRYLRPGGILVVEIGRHRRRLERAFPRTPFVWPETSAGDDSVFLLEREQLPASGAESLQLRRQRPKAGQR
jgi:ribosomal protein L3 glutamine methyltransferase